MRKSRRVVLALGVVLAILGLVLACGVESPPGPRAAIRPAAPRATSLEAGTTPLGMYAHVPLQNILTYSAGWSDAGPNEAGVSTDAWYQHLLCLFTGLLDNPAVAGLEINLNWDQIDYQTSAPPSPPIPYGRYDWTGISAAFDAVHAWNAGHGGSKRVQLIIIPGFTSPGWLLNGLTLCDGELSAGPKSVAADCDAVTISGYVEGNAAAAPCGQIWPLPWGAKYKQAWNDFLQVVSGYLQSTCPPGTAGGCSSASSYYSDLVSIAMAGPTGDTAEMYVPHFNAPEGQLSANFGAQIQTYTTSRGTSSYPLNDLMSVLMTAWGETNPTYPILRSGDAGGQPLQNDDVFLGEWVDTVTSYAQYFPGVTLILTPGDGDSFPVVSDTTDFTQPCSLNGGSGNCGPFYEHLCPNNQDMSCALTATILWNFVNGFYGPRGIKLGLQTSGLYAQEGPNVGINGVRYVTKKVGGKDAVDGGNSFVGGAQFAHAFTNSYAAYSGTCMQEKWDEAQCSPAAVLYAVLGAAFDGTVAASFFPPPLQAGHAGLWGVQQNESLQFLQVNYLDLEYATNGSCCLGASGPPLNVCSFYRDDAGALVPPLPFPTPTDAGTLNSVQEVLLGGACLLGSAATGVLADCGAPVFQEIDPCSAAPPVPAPPDGGFCRHPAAPAATACSRSSDCVADGGPAGFCGPDGTCQLDIGVCPVTSLETNLSYPNGVTVGGNEVYFTQATTIGTVDFVGVPMTSGVAGRTASGQRNPNYIVADTDCDAGPCNVYWTDYGGGTVKSAPMNAGAHPPITTLATGQTTPYRVAIDGANVYWTSETAAMVGAVPKGGGTPQTLWSHSGGGVWGVASDGTDVYWTHSGAAGGALLRKKIAGGEVTTLATSQCPGSVSVAAATSTAPETIYWTDYCLATVNSTPAAGGASTPLSNPGSPWDIAADRQCDGGACNVYWTNETGTILATPLPLKAGGTIVTLASGQGSPKGIALDGTHVYWVINVDTGTPDAGLDSGSVVFVSKP